MIFGIQNPAADDDFIKLLYSLQNCVMHLKKKYFFLPPYFYEKSCLKLNLKISHKLR